jgi:hypothetical protein
VAARLAATQTCVMAAPLARQPNQRDETDAVACPTGHEWRRVVPSHRSL